MRCDGASLGEIRIKLPSVELLKTTPAYVLKDIWQKGEKYFTVLEKWLGDPTDTNTERLAEQLIAYSKMTVNRINAEQDQLQAYKIAQILPRDIIHTLSTISGGLIAYSTGASEPTQVVVSASVGLVSIIVLRPVFKTFDRKAKLADGSVRIESRLPGQSVARSLSSLNLWV